MLLPQDFTFNIPKHEHMRELHLASLEHRTKHKDKMVDYYSNAFLSLAQLLKKVDMSAELITTRTL